MPNFSLVFQSLPCYLFPCFRIRQLFTLFPLPSFSLINFFSYPWGIIQTCRLHDNKDNGLFCVNNIEKKEVRGRKFWKQLELRSWRTFDAQASHREHLVFHAAVKRASFYKQTKSCYRKGKTTTFVIQRYKYFLSCQPLGFMFF